jgi:predicted ATP-grasp superfamily ATP-dependent carboligase
MPATLVVAGLSARALAEAAREGGWDVVALDLFGDRDTRRASRWWRPIGEPARLRIDPVALRAALAEAALLPDAAGWVPGGGFEGAPELLEAGGAALPCLAMAADDVRRLRRPDEFFGTLDRLRIGHPAVTATPPARADGWLAKRAGGSGGLHVRPAAEAAADPSPPPDDLYFQREQPGTPMSALFVADGERAAVVAINRLLIATLGGSRHAYAGAIGPVCAPALERRLDAALAALVPAFALRGLASLDFVADAQGHPWLLEINPRPSASMALHAGAWPGGLVRAHVEAVRGRLPPGPACRRAGVRGTRVVFASCGGLVDDALSDALAATPHVHDLPAAGTRFAAGDPVCSVSAECASVDEVSRVLFARAARVLMILGDAAGMPGSGPEGPDPEQPGAHAGSGPSGPDPGMSSLEEITLQ